MKGYRHASTCNWLRKHPDYRSSGMESVCGGAPTVLVYDSKHGTCLAPCSCWQMRAQLEPERTPEKGTTR